MNNITCTPEMHLAYRKTLIFTILLAVVTFLLPQLVYFDGGGTDVQLRLRNTELSLAQTAHAGGKLSSAPVNDSMSKCPTSVAISSGLLENNASEIQCIEKIISDCQPSNFSLLYGTGSIKVNVSGSEKADGCSIRVNHEVEGSVTKLNCSLPIGKLVWNSWKKGIAFSAIDDLVPYCTREN